LRDFIGLGHGERTH